MTGRIECDPHMREDVKSAFRSLRSSSNITVAALAVLTLAIGATTAIWSWMPSRCGAYRSPNRIVSSRLAND